ncbi:hypothetical protein JIN77_06055 [Verrucomicrobiaceae bacterium R5-34]|uniref:Porin n=1 Tax=Oceaniferula flava TaxID=2800421 RepID=A0AAE2SBT9_9BACT|nr:porin [Oceaniferula flavus]MBK1830278.1 hypothetical protein [Verrucomicrobiaceae bacterium R5-34]MBK1854869.1 hypothetical protein [Oceaniferula flavus]MBM1136175.1 hypothetical protein [Oceaniferula flavus]
MKKVTNVASRAALAGSAVALAISTASAGEPALPPVTPPASNGDFCSWLTSKPGTIYKNSDNPIIQEVGIFGRMQYQQAWIDGDAGGQDFWYDSEGEFRRLRLGARVKFLEYFHLWANADMEQDTRPSGGDLDIEYADIYEAQLLFNAQKAFGMSGFDKFELGVGKAEIKLSDEVATSSKKIKTIERSAIANKVFPQPNLTGAWMNAEAGKFSYYFGVFSTESSTEIADWDVGTLYHGRLGYDLTESTPFESAEAILALAYVDHDSNNADDDLVSFDWVASAIFRAEQGRGAFNANLIFGENRDMGNSARDGNFWGAVLMPSYWIVDDRVEAVFRYQYQHASKSEGIRLNSRYVRNAGDARQEDIASLRNGRGDEHHSLYLGLNYYFCGHNSKLMAGVEWEDLDSDGEDIYEGFTYGLAYRMFF